MIARTFVLLLFTLALACGCTQPPAPPKPKQLEVQSEPKVSPPVDPKKTFEAK